MRLKIGRVYSREEIAATVGGSAVTFLPTAEGRVTCICLVPEKNPEAPAIVPVGPGRRRLDAADLFSTQPTAVPLFIKLGTKQWEYQGDYKCRRLVTDQRHVRRIADPQGRTDAKAILFLEGEGPESRNSHGIADEEGSLLLRMHYRRERSRSLVKLKIADARRTDQFYCAVCGLAFDSRPWKLRPSTAEVHHLRPLGRLGPLETVRTRLKDLALVCANCHRMIHATEPMLTIPRLRRQLRP